MAQKHVQARVAERCAPIVSYGCRQKEAARADSLDTHARERGAGPPAARSLFALVERPSRVQPHLVPCFGVSPFAGTATDRTCCLCCSVGAVAACVAGLSRACLTRSFAVS